MWDISGSPVFAPYSDGVYFAVSARGQLGSAQSTNLNIFVGSVDCSGNVQWVSTFGTALQPVGADAWNPAITIGPTNEIYIVYSTNGVIQGGHSSGNIDLVLARIDTNGTTPVVRWIKQDLTLNTVIDDIDPAIAIDSKNGYLYVSDTIHYSSTEIMIRCYDLLGNLLWLYIQPPARKDYINSTGINQKSSITTDNNGALFLAYETSGLSPMFINIPNKQVDIIKFHTIQTGPTYDYVWDWTFSKLYSDALWARDGNSINPRITFSNNRLYVAFQTSGTITGLQRSSAQYDVISACLLPNGSLEWKYQGLPSLTPILNIYSVSIVGNNIDLYISAVVHTNQSYDNIFIWKLDNFKGTNKWTQNSELSYQYGSENGLNYVFPTTGFGFLQSSIIAYQNRLYLGSLTTVSLSARNLPRWVTLTSLGERNYDLANDAFQHLTLNCLNTCP